MSKEQTSRSANVHLTQYWGGLKKGRCLQVSVRKGKDSKNQFFDYVQLTRSEALALSKDLLDFAYGTSEEVV